MIRYFALRNTCKVYFTVRLQEIHESYEIDDEEVEEGDEYQETETDERTDYIIIPLKEPEESTKIEVEVEEEQQQSETEESEDKEFVDMFINMQTACLDGHYICNLCRKEFKFAKSLQTHMKKHSNWIKVRVYRFVFERIYFKNCFNYLLGQL